MRHAINKLAGALFCIGACAAAPVASALPISLLDTTFTPGAGYGIDIGPNGENGATLLDVFFSSAATPQHGGLSNSSAIRSPSIWVRCTSANRTSGAALIWASAAGNWTC